MELKLFEHHFSGDDPILVMYFLTRFVPEANIQAMSEAQAFIALPSLLKEFGRCQYQVELRWSRRKNEVYQTGLSRKYLLRNFAQYSKIVAAIGDLRALSQGPKINGERVCYQNSTKRYAPTAISIPLRRYSRFKLMLRLPQSVQWLHGAEISIPAPHTWMSFIFLRTKVTPFLQEQLQASPSGWKKPCRRYNWQHFSSPI